MKLRILKQIITSKSGQTYSTETLQYFENDTWLDVEIVIENKTL